MKTHFIVGLGLMYKKARHQCNKSSLVAEMGDRGHNRHAPKRGAAVVALSRGGARFPSNTMWPGPVYSRTIGIFIHPAVWPQ